MMKLERENKLKKINYYVTHKEQKLPNGVHLIQEYENKNNGFYGAAFSMDGNIVIVYRGTDLNLGLKEVKKDLKIDKQMAKKEFPDQLVDARKFYEQIKKSYPNQKLEVSGYSLGGSLAQGIATRTGVRATTFGAYGIGDILGKDVKYTDNIVNYGNVKDPIFMFNVDNQVGKIKLLEGSLPAKIPYNLLKHLITKMGKLENAQEYIPKNQAYKVLTGYVEKSHSIGGSGYQFLEEAKKLDEESGSSTSFLKNLRNSNSSAIRLEERLRREWRENGLRDAKEFDEIGFDKRYINEVTGDDRIFTKEDIIKMSEEEYQKHKKSIAYQKKTIGIPTQEQAKRQVSAGGMVHVSSYTRSDGTHVDAYYRSMPLR